MGQILADEVTAVQKCIDSLNIAAASDTAEKLCLYQKMLEDWNRRMNLTGDASFETVLDRHFSDCLSALQIADAFPGGASMIDVGSGAGFPGMVLAIARPDLKLLLLDSLNKRIGFLDAVVQKLELTNVRTLHSRSEDAGKNPLYREKFDVAVARAVAALPVLSELLLPFVRVGGQMVCMKGPAAAEEIPQADRAARMLGGGTLHAKPVILPAHPDWGHCVVLCRKCAPTPLKYPRKAGTPNASPLGVKA